MSIYFGRHSYLSNVLFLDCQEQASVSAKLGYVWQEKSSISSTVMNLAYMLFHWHSWRLRKSRVSPKGYFFKITFKYIYLKSVHSGLKSKAIMSHNWCNILGLYFASSCMCLFSTYFEDGRMSRIFWNHQLHPGFPWLIRVTNGLKYYLLFQITSLEYGFAARLE